MAEEQAPTTQPAEEVVGARGIPADGSAIKLDMGVVIEALRCGKACWREGWNKNTMRVRMVKVPVGHEEGQPDSFATYLGIPMLFDEHGKLLDYWHPSPQDLFSDDWHFE